MPQGGGGVPVYLRVFHAGAVGGRGGGARKPAREKNLKS